MPRQALPKHHHRAVFYDDPGDESRPSGDKGVGYTKCLHKKPWEESRYLIPNEVICAEFGKLIGLPIPPYAVTYSIDGTMWFSSLYFNFDEEELPDVLPDCFWEHLRKWHSGVVVFDIFVMNADRHDENIAVDNPTRPTAFRLFDHDQSLLGGATHKALGVSRLVANRDMLGISEPTGGMRNDFIDEMTDSRSMSPWIMRIKDLKDWMIDNCVDAGARYGLSNEESTALKDFLKVRRDRLTDIIMGGAVFFSGIETLQVDGRLL